MSEQPDPMNPLDPDHDGEVQPDADDLDELPIDPADPLKRSEEEDQPGLDPTPPLIPED